MGSILLVGPAHGDFNDEMFESPEPRWVWPKAAYVHIPFCAHHCGYCDFAVAVGKDDRAGAYLRALDVEMRRLERPQRVETLFFGGGTPTYLSAGDLDRCLTAVRRWFPPVNGQEFSIEANPGTFDAEKLRVLRDHGVTRVSLGCQSFDAGVLRVLERDHRPEDAIHAVEILKESDMTLSLDLIFGVPGQTLEQWRSDLNRAIALEPNGIATYGLTFEKGTRLWKQRRAGEVVDLGEDRELAMYEMAMDVLEAAGFVHVEISNFAKPGRECRHNQAYWANDAHWGFGLGAAEYVRGTRRINTRDLETYLRRLATGMDPRQSEETLGPRERALETLGQNLRRDRGVDRFDFAQRTGHTLEDLAGTTAATLQKMGLVGDDGERMWLTRAGKCVADSVMAEFWKNLEPR